LFLEERMKWLAYRVALILAALVGDGCCIAAREGYPADQSDPDGASDGIPFDHFLAHNATMTCTADEHARPFNNQIRGVNLGGWMVLEPWITPSLFYQFLGNTNDSAAFDMYTFCDVLGPEEGNRQLQRHWDAWLTQDIIKDLAGSGAVNSLRLPIGDFLYMPYGPYVGCTDGALDRIDDLLDWAYTHGLTVLLDIHTMKDSQNGFDNSGQAMGFEWTSNLNSERGGLTTFEHWPIRTAEWIGTFDPHTATYSNLKHANIRHALDVIQEIVNRYSGHPAVLGLEPINEPWQYTPIDVLKRFYWEGYLIVKKNAPYWKYIMHDSFRFDPNLWGGFMDGCPERALDTHIYQAWRIPDSRIGFYTDACRQKSYIAAMERAFGPVIVGEWSLATDNCAMYLNGFNGAFLLACFVACVLRYLRACVRERATWTSMGAWTSMKSCTGLDVYSTCLFRSFCGSNIAPSSSPLRTPSFFSFSYPLYFRT
jgi:glucan 1,3-beta-glucosidase